MSTPPDPTPPRPPTPVAAPGVVEWRLASPDGAEQYGPTVPTVFANWIGEGRVRADWLVWRTGWDDWRTAAEAAAELPQPAAPPPPPPPAPPPTQPAQTASRIKPNSRPPTDAVSLYRRRRRVAARRTATLASALALLAAGLIALLVWLLGS